MRKLTPIGTVVVAVSHSEGKKLYVFGRGVFEGCFLPTAINLSESVEKFQKEYVRQASVTPDLPPTFTDEEARKAIILSQANPRIRLTETFDGKPLDTTTDNVVWGFECWWGTEEDFSEDSGKFEIVNITVAQHRADVEQMQKEAAEEEAQLQAALCSMGMPHAHDHSHEN